MTVILGIDPGDRSVGVVLAVSRPRASLRLLESGTFQRPRSGLPVHPDEVDSLVSSVEELADEMVPDLVAIEGITRPSWFLGGGRAAANPEPLLATAVMLGACINAWSTIAPRVVLVPPGGNGGGPLGSYPALLVSDAERRLQRWEARTSGDTAKLRHERSAWDVALVASRMVIR
jgi:hypothetical protein